jgi:hypothetical protein
MRRFQRFGVGGGAFRRQLETRAFITNNEFAVRPFALDEIAAQSPIVQGK